MIAALGASIAAVAASIGLGVFVMSKTEDENTAPIVALVALIAFGALAIYLV